MLFIRAAWDIFAGAAAAFCGSGFAFASKLATVGLGFSDAIGLATGTGFGAATWGFGRCFIACRTEVLTAVLATCV